MKYRISHLISRDVFPIHDDSGNCVLVATRDEAKRIALHLVELINEPIDWPSQPKQCAEFKVLDIGECDRCTFVVGHEGRHSFEPVAEGASPAQEKGK